MFTLLYALVAVVATVTTHFDVIHFHVVICDAVVADDNMDEMMFLLLLLLLFKWMLILLLLFLTLMSKKLT